jgi:pyruvate dehydrogenase E2 component (dihydrolipoamide acetyltransferase)
MGASDPDGTFDFALPSLGADMDTGKVIEWCVEIGDTVARGDIMCVVHTEKSDIDVEIWHGGVIEEFLVEVGEEIDVGTPIARIRGEGGAPPKEPVERDMPTVLAREGSGDGAYPAPDDDPGERVPAAATTAAPPAAPAVGRGAVPASPYARRLAREKGLDLGTVRGTGPGGAVVAADVTAAPAAEAKPSTAEPDSMRRLIAERMSKANRDIPHYHLSLDVDVGEVFDQLAALNETLPIAERILPAALYVHAVGRALARHRAFNGFWVDGAFQPGEQVNVAMAISLRRGGLMTPHVERADELGLRDTMARLTELVTAARTGNLRARWMTGSTITITNLGDFGADLVHGVISPPQVGLVGIGRPRERAWVVDGEVVPRTVLTLTLAADHRATDGMTGSRFLNTIADNLTRLPEEP